MIADETSVVCRLGIQGYFFMFLQYLSMLKALELGRIEVVHSFNIHGTLRVVWSKLLKLEVVKCQSNETLKC
jgi:hypothetical protein